MDEAIVPPKVLILLAAYNGSDYIEEQIDSILAQKGVEISILISLDASTDNTLDILNVYISNYKSVSMLPYGEKLGSAGKNFFHLINEATIHNFDFIAFADQDDIWLEDKIYNAIQLMRNSNADGYSSNVTAFWGDGRKALVKKSYPQAKYDYLFESPGPGCSFVISNKLFTSIKYQISENYKSSNLPWLHDWYCYSFARFNNYKWVIDEKSYMLYRQHGSNEVGANSGAKAFFSRAKVILRGDGLEEVISQADFIGQEKLLPIQSLSHGRRGALKLALLSFSLRRKFTHKFFCLFYFFILSVIGFKLKSCSK
ncbi:glycosyltransferase [Pseudoalteromonas agarivorans]|uniref:Rhamnosyltransferase n=1 Tax=Pseudoalteromonas agarivorans DSM 14585 TaxID=1312369 RepID=A0ACA8DSN9_9GAMM|nr:glycosyltransferase [Pseudoalteromonas agarivorans]ATC81071.1 rhamnosyltransferase [Pseudoalteromonas agarivorans DSM 14585]